MIIDTNSLNQGYLPKKQRRGCKDIWNAHLVKGAYYSDHDIPICPTYLPSGLPQELISYKEAKTIFNKETKIGRHNFQYPAFVHFYLDDYQFDGARDGIWIKPEKALEILIHFAGIITPDFSTYSDFPDPLKRYNTYRMRAFGYWCYTKGISVINNVRWGTSETWEYCFDGIEHNSVVCIGNVASGLREIENRYDYKIGFQKMLNTIKPCTIIILGSSNYEIFDYARKEGIELLTFMSPTNNAFIKRKKGEKHE